MSQYTATRIFGELVRCADIESAINALTNQELRGLSAYLDKDPQYAKTGIPGMIQGLLQVEAAHRFMQGGEA